LFEKLAFPTWGHLRENRLLGMPGLDSTPLRQPSPLLNWGQLGEPGEATLTLLRKTMGEGRQRGSRCWLSGFAQHVSAVHLPSASL